MSADRSQLERNAGKALTALMSYKGDRRSKEYRTLAAALSKAQAALDDFDRAAENVPEPAASSPEPAWIVTIEARK
jgi:hypothetical protein